MTFTLQDLKHLEIMAELEGSPVLPSEEPVAAEPVAPASLTEKLLTLASKLRAAGFIQQSESLEGTFGMYKKAEQDIHLLYRAQSETGDDLLEMAHPDGDVEIAPAQDRHGFVETPISQHKKILDIVQKKAVVDMLSQSLNVKTAVWPFSAAPAFTAGLSAPGTSAGAAGAATAAPAAPAAAGLGPFAGAVLVGAIGGIMLGNWLFDRYLEPKELGNAGKALIDQTESFKDAGIYNDKLSESARNYLNNFKATFGQVMEQYPSISEMKKNPSKEGIEKIKVLQETIRMSIRHAFDIKNYADKKMDDKTLSFRWSPLTNHQNIVTAASNYINVGMEIMGLAGKFLTQAQEVEDKFLAQQSQSASPATALFNKFTKIISSIETKINVMDTTKPENYKVISDWLKETKPVIEGHRKAFKENTGNSTPEILAHYTNIYNGILEKLKPAGITE